MRNTSIVIASATFATLGLAGCLENKTTETNSSPEANAGEDQNLDYDGSPVRVTLDGSGSSDRDGTVTRYVWKSADSDPDGGVLDGAPDPDDEEKPELRLDMGSYKFNLWVFDNQDAISAPDQVTIRVGSDPVAACMAEVHPDVLPSCSECVCGMSPECAAAAVACTEDCWGLILCIGMNCPDTSDIPCITSNCAPFLGGATSAMAVGACIPPCIVECTPDDLAPPAPATDGGV